MPFVRGLRSGTLRFIRAARVAHLATVSAAGEPLVIPVCFVFDGRHFFTPIDEKPKKTAASRLRRVRNVLENPRVCLVIDQYEEDWRRLAYVLVVGTAKLLFSGVRHGRAIALLRRKYPQYRAMTLEGRPAIMIIPQKIVTWAGSSARADEGAGRGRQSRGKPL